MTELNSAERRALLASVASLLVSRGKWALTETEHGNLKMTSVTGPSIWARFEGYGSKAGMMSVYVHWPKEGPNGAERQPRGQSHTINISLSKSPQQIAGDIERRLLPEYLKSWDVQQALVDQSNAYEAKRQEAFDRIAKATGGEVIRDSNDRERTTLDWPRGGKSFDKGYITGLLVSDDTLQFEVRSVPIELGIQILQMIKKSSGGL